MFRTDPSNSRTRPEPGVSSQTPGSGPGGAPEPQHPPSDRLHRLPGREANRATNDPGREGALLFPTTLFQQPHSVLVFGPSRRLVRLALFAFASWTNPEFHWVEFSPPASDRTPCDPVRLGWIPDDRLWLVHSAKALEANNASLTVALSKMISAEETPEERNRLTQFLRLPEMSQRILASQTPNGHPGVVAVSEVHEATDNFTPNQVVSLLSLHQDLGFSVMIGHYRPPGPGRDLFDFVFRLQGEGERFEDWKRYRLICEKGIVSGPLRGRRAVLLEDVPHLLEILSRARTVET